MTKLEIENYIDKIKAASNNCDDEIAHALEDEMRERFLIYMKKLNLGDVSDLASLCLSTRDISFSRWVS